jgi:cytidylate kinase
MTDSKIIHPIVLAFGGAALSGKSFLSTKVAVALGWPRGSFGDFVRDEARIRGLDDDRSTLQKLGQELVHTDPEAMCRQVLRRANWVPGSPAVLDGVRHQVVVETLKRIVAPEPFVLILLEASHEDRIQRLNERLNVSKTLGERTSLQEIDADATESDVQSILPRLADLVLTTGSGGDDRLRDVLEWLSARLAIDRPFSN